MDAANEKPDRIDEIDLLRLENIRLKMELISAEMGSALKDVQARYQFELGKDQVDFTPGHGTIVRKKPDEETKEQ